MIYSSHRPSEYQGQGDSRLEHLVRKTKRMLCNIQQDFAYDTLHLDRDALGDLAGILVDFAEDLHNDTGIWEAYERYNVEFYGTALPLTLGEGSDSRTGFHSDRFRHMLWILYPLFIDGLVLSPMHQDLLRQPMPAAFFYPKHSRPCQKIQA